jgi:hypothetical protein
MSFFSGLIIFVFMELKSCYVCKTEKELTEFYKDKSRSSGLSSKCKVCHNINTHRKRKLKKETDPEYRKFANRKRTEQKKRKMLENPEYRKLVNQKKEKRNVIRESKDPVYKLKRKMRHSLRDAFRRKGYSKNTQSQEILGADWNTVKKYFESKFVDGMSWDNQGDWHIDHILPISTAINEEDVLRLNHYTNLQPLWAEDNMKKSDVLTEESYLKQLYPYGEITIDENSTEIKISDTEKIGWGIF